MTSRMYWKCFLMLAVMAAHARPAEAIGPDAFGYTAVSQPFVFDQLALYPGATRVFYSPTSIINSGTATVPIGFAFDFYGTTYTTVTFNLEGLVTFGGSNSNTANVNFGTTTLSPNLPAIAALWDDWRTFTTPTGAGVWYHTLGTAPNRRFIIQWADIRSGNIFGTSPIHFDAILYEGSNDIVLQHTLVKPGTAAVNNGASATVGIRDVDGQSNGRRLQWSFNSAVITDGSAIRFSYPNDLDQDGVPISSDNCPKAYNPDQADCDQDGIGDACPSSYQVQSPAGSVIDDPQTIGGLVSGISQNDDATTFVSFGGPHFNFYGATYSGVFVNTNGNLTFGFGDTDNTETAVEFLGQEPRIGGFWDDLLPCRAAAINGTGGLFVNRLSDRLVATWRNVPEFTSGGCTSGGVGSNTFQITIMFATGQIVINMDGITSLDSIVGIGPGIGAVNPGEVNLSSVSGTGVLFGDNQAIYEQFPQGSATDQFDLNGRTLVFSPITGCGGNNQPPTCTGDDGPFMVNVGQAFSNIITGDDPDGDVLTISAAGLPPGASVTPASGAAPVNATCQWTPSISDVNDQHQITITFTDPDGEYASCSFDVVVVNLPPECHPEDGTFMVNVGEAFSHTVEGHDFDPGDTLTLGASGRPSGASLSPSEGSTFTSETSVAFDWTPTVADFGQHDVSLIFTDQAGDIDTCVFTVFVLNRVPSCSGEPENTVIANIGDPVAIMLHGHDDDPGDTLTVALVELPSGSSVAQVGSGQNVDAAFSWTPTINHFGLHHAVIRFTDINGDYAECSFDIMVANRPPQCTPHMSEPAIVTVGETYEVSITADDLDDGDLLTITNPSGVPVGATLSPAPSSGSAPAPRSATFTWAPTDADAAGNPHMINVTFTDYNGASDACSLAIVVNRNPVADCGAGDVTVECTSAAGAEVSLDGSASFDPDPEDAGNLRYHWDVSDLDVSLDNPDSATPTGTFPEGVTMATLTVVDQRGGVNTCDFLVTVQDTTPPEVMVTTNCAALWPPNHTMRTINLMIVATDVCENPEDILPIIVTIRSDEPDNATGNGDGNTTGDVNGHDGYSSPVNITSLTYSSLLGGWVGAVQLRAERDGNGDGRAYTIDVIAFDTQNNAASTSCVVVVPHDRRGG